MTREIKSAAEALVIAIHDHLSDRPQGPREFRALKLLVS
jgi:hypothetical protein